jgi:MFS family permease
VIQAVAALCGAPFVILWGRAGALGWVIFALAAWGFSKGLFDANSFAAIFDVVLPQVRGMPSGFLNMAGFLGGGAAPVIIGFLSERYGTSWAISFAAIPYLLAGVLLVIALAFFIRQDVGRVSQFVNAAKP